VTIRRCPECPFFRATLMALIARGDQAGQCSYDVDADGLVLDPDPDLPVAERVARQERLLRRLRVEDRRVVPAACPLRRGLVVVRLADEAGGAPAGDPA
jgi:hypothetical protein